jgi:hypothetical protein
VICSSLKDFAATQREEILRERKRKEVAILAVLAKGGVESAKDSQKCGSIR